MSFRSKLMTFFVVTIVAAVTMVAWGVSVYSRAAFEEFDRQRTDALVAQFRREYAQRGEEIAHRVQSVADAEATLRMAMDLNRPQADASQYYNDAHGIAQSQQLDFMDIVADDGTLISSSEWPARFGYKIDWVSGEPDWNSKGAFLSRVEMPDAVDLGLIAVRSVRVGEKRLFLIGGQRLDQNFLVSLVLPEGMRTLLYRNLEQNFTPSELTDPHGAVSQPDLFASMIAEAQKNQKEAQNTVTTGVPPNTISETFNAIPLAGRGGDPLGVLLVGSSRQNLIQMLNFIRILALMVGGAVIALSMLLGWWISARVTRPIEELAAASREVAAGHWKAHVEVHSRDEVGQLANAFNEMTDQLTEQREQLVQTERVAAWRELARRLAHELKNPLFPLQLTVENLQRAREQTSEQFDEVFFESTATLRAELESLKTIVSRFSDFAKMPTPEFEPVDLNELVRSAIKLFEPQLAPVGRPPITPELYLDEKLPKPMADPILLRRALENLILNSLDAMPAGGTLTVRTAHRPGAVRLEVTDTGEGLSPEECSRLFTPYYTTKRHGTGLGLAIVQSVVSDHSGRIEVESAPGAGATFRIELPMEQKASPEKETLAGEKPVDPPVFTTA
ncbi:MAG TPA: ATP-binding protein [Candidatus Saccharimonadales bacterium]|jgi:two-component system nitrogen regulation sensor histidine kinase NtrY|nr:ATP-binding protein [Candidatus Saccharimonadales bacterium]